MKYHNDYFCCKCGLLYYGYLNDKSIRCPNTKCLSHSHQELYAIRVGTIKFNHILKNPNEFFQRIAWSSSYYTTEEKLKRYQGLGVRVSH